MINTEINKYNYDPLEAPIYYPAEVARFVKIHPSRVHRWLKGYEYTYESYRKKQKPIIKVIPKNYASFLDLVDLLFVKRFLDYGISLQKLRKALEEAKEILGTDHFARESFFTDGKYICLQVRDKGDAILELLSGGQWVISNIIKQLAHQIDFDQITALACRWFPLEKNRLVVLDPNRSFGRPIIERTGVPTETIYNLYLAEKKKIKPVCNWMSLSYDEVEAAIKFEEYLLFH